MENFKCQNELERILYRQLYKKSFYEFVKAFWCEADPQEFVDGILVQFYCEFFQYLCRGWVDYKKPDKEIVLPKLSDDIDIIDVRQDNKHCGNINIPPRHSKSMVLNVLAGCWIWINYPIKLASVSHTEGLAGTMNKKRQKVLNSEKFKYFFPEIELEKNTSFSLINTDGGELYSINRNALTGYGFDIGVMDDLTNAEVARKDKTEMQNAVEFYRNTLPSRINDPNNYVILNIQQRLAPNDVTGFIMNDPGLSSQYIFVVLPAIFEKETYLVCPISGDVYHFKKGDYLWPERFGDYSGLRAQVGETVFQTQYLQKSIASDRTIIKEDMIIEKDSCDVPDISEAEMIYSSHDFPVKDKETSDYLGSMLAYRVGSTLYITDCLEKRMAFVQSVNYVKQLDQVYPGIIQIIEDKANGSPILQQLKDEVAGMQAFQPGTQSKMQRLESASLYMTSGNVVFVRTIYDKISNTYRLSDSLNNLKQRLLAFPFVEHDDICDAFSMMILFVFMEKRYMVYGKSFNDQNIIDTSLVNTTYSSIFFNKEGDSWKVCEISIDYGIESKLYVKRETLFKATIQDGLEELKKFAPDKSVFIDCSATEALYGIYQNNVSIENYNVDDFDQSVAQLNLCFSNKTMFIDKECKLIKSDIDNFKYDKTKDDNNLKFKTQKDGFVSCLRSAIRYYGL